MLNLNFLTLNQNSCAPKVQLLYPDSILPQKPTSILDSGWDVSAHNIKAIYGPSNECIHTLDQHPLLLSEIRQYVLSPGYRILVGTGIKISTEPGYETQVRPRSGLSLKQGYTITNSPGTIESCVYRGEVGVIITNNTQTSIVFTHQMRIAQLVVAPVTLFHQWEVVDQLPPSSRGEGGFGSSGS